MCGGPVGDVLDATSDALGTSGDGGGILGAVEDVAQGAGDVLADLDKATGYNMEIVAPLVVAAVAAPYLAPALAEGAVASGAATAAEAAAALEAAAIAEGATTAGMVGAANTGIPAGTTLLGGGSGLVGGAEFLPTGEDFYMGEFLPTGEDFNMGVSLGDADIQPGGFYGGGATPEATIIPGELGDIILDASGNVVTSSGADILAAPSSFSISPMQAIQGARLASGLLSGRPQQPQTPQMQMGGRTQMPQGAVDYSGLYNLLALQRARNPNSLLG